MKIYTFFLQKAMHESNGLGIITALILNDINPLGKVRMDLVLELRNNASKLLLAIMESRSSDPENVAEKIIYNMNPKQLIDVACKAYHQQLLGMYDIKLKIPNYNFWSQA